MKNKSSFIFGESPSAVPIYAVVSMCGSGSDSEPSPKHANEIEASSKFYYKKNPYIPLTKTPEIYDYSSVASNKVNDDLNSMKSETNEVDGHQDDDVKANRRKRSDESLINQTQPVNLTEQSNERWKAISTPSVIIYTKDDKIVLPSVPQSIKVDEIKIVHDNPVGSTSNIPHFHVTYWMFYPFSQGKTVCTLNLGPLGPIPIPLLPIFNICLGTKKEFGSHVGDWEHMSLFFRGRMEPDVSSMTLSLFQAQLIISDDWFLLDRKCMCQPMMLEPSTASIVWRERLSSRVKRREKESFRSQRSPRQSSLPTTIQYSSQLKARTVFGRHQGNIDSSEFQDFTTSMASVNLGRRGRMLQSFITMLEVSCTTFRDCILHDDYSSLCSQGKRSMGGSNPNWMKYRGKWGNPKTKCHPLRRIGLHVCEQTDGPTGIPKKTAHFTCTRWRRWSSIFFCKYLSRIFFLHPLTPNLLIAQDKSTTLRSFLRHFACACQLNFSLVISYLFINQ